MEKNGRTKPRFSFPCFFIILGIMFAKYKLREYIFEPPGTRKNVLNKIQQAYKMLKGPTTLTNFRTWSASLDGDIFHTRFALWKWDQARLNFQYHPVQLKSTLAILLSYLAFLAKSVVCYIFTCSYVLNHSAIHDR